MQDFTELRRTLENFLNTNFALCPIEYENLELENKSDLRAWISVHDKSSVSESTGMGESTYYLGGIITINIFTQLGIGTNEARILANGLSDLFNSTEVSGLNFQTPELYTGPENKKWYQHKLIIRYTTVMGQEDSDGC